MKKVSKASKPKGNVSKRRDPTESEKVKVAEIISIADTPGFLDHLFGRRFRVRVECYDDKNEVWQDLAVDEGNEVWLLQYPERTNMLHVALQADRTPPKETSEAKFINPGAFVEDSDVPF